MPIEQFYTIAIDQTQYWSPDELQKHGIKRAFGLYLMREGEATYVCSLVPSSWMLALKNEFIFRDDATEAQIEHSYELEYEDVSDGSYYTNMINPAKYNTAYIAGPLLVHVEDDDDPETMWRRAEEEWHEDHQIPPLHTL